jgi:hypothetical protein
VGVKIGGKGWQGEDNGNHCRRRSRVFVRMNAPSHTTKFQDLPRQTAMPDPPLRGEEVSGEGKMMQNLYCSCLRQLGIQVPGGHVVSELK